MDDSSIAATKEFLTFSGWPKGLQDTLFKSLPLSPLRYFIVDDSGSMATNDGHRVMTTKAGTTKYEENLLIVNFL